MKNDRKGRKIVENGKNEGKSLKTGGNGGKWRKMEECQEKSRKKTKENGRKKTTEKEGKSLKTEGKWRKMEEC